MLKKHMMIKKLILLKAIFLIISVVLVNCAKDNPVTPATTPNPDKAVTTFPANGATGIDRLAGTNLTWNAAANATDYQVYLSTANPPAYSGVTSALTYPVSSAILSGSPGNTTFYWRIDSKNSAAATTGDVWSFTTAPAANPNSVSIFGMAFNPSTMAVTSGTTVTWTNNDSTTHTVTSNTLVFDSGNLAPTQTFTYTFNVPGTYPYKCTIHPSMTASITVN